MGRARALAAGLERRLGPDRGPVAVYGGRQWQLPTAFLACLFSGRAYIPLEDSCPRRRTLDILEDSGARLLLAVEPLEGAPCPTLGGEELEALFHGPAQESDPAGPGPEELCYLIYTSGSTGRPKGVEIAAQNLDAFLDATRGLGGEEDPRQTVWLTHAPFSFDLSVLPLWQGLGSGGLVVDLDTSRGMDYPRLFGEMRASGATCWVSTPSFARFCLADPGFDQGLLPELSAFCFCGEVLPRSLARALWQRFPRVRLLNSYGPTETTVAVTLTRLSPEMAEEDRPLPVGRPLAGVEIFITGPQGELLEPGARGEICIAGALVGRGYHGLEELTRRRFFSREGQPAFRTGDMGFLEEGMLHFLGREDLQVKCRGCRVELEDLEQNLLALPGVAAALAVAQGELLGALVVPQAGLELLPRELLRQLRDRVPGYLVPRRILCRGALPLTPGGKADRKQAKELIFP